LESALFDLVQHALGRKFVIFQPQPLCFVLPRNCRFRACTSQNNVQGSRSSLSEAGMLFSQQFSRARVTRFPSLSFSGRDLEVWRQMGRCSMFATCSAQKQWLTLYIIAGSVAEARRDSNCYIHEQSMLKTGDLF
jgi:hypothetical protein